PAGSHPASATDWRGRGGAAMRARIPSSGMTLCELRRRSPTLDLLVHPARHGAARRALRSFPSGLLGLPGGCGAIGPAAELHAYTTLHLGSSVGREENQRGDGREVGDAVQLRALHGGKVGMPPGLSTTASGGVARPP